MCSDYIRTESGAGSPEPLKEELGNKVVVMWSLCDELLLCLWSMGPSWVWVMTQLSS